MRHTVFPLFTLRRRYSPILVWLCDVTTRLLLLLCDIVRRLLFCVVTPLAWLCQLQLGHPQAIAQLVSDVLAHFLFNALHIVFRTFCI